MHQFLTRILYFLLPRWLGLWYGLSK